MAQKISLTDIAKACGYKKSIRLNCRAELGEFLKINKQNSSPIFVEIIVKKGNRPDLGRPKNRPIDNKIEFQNYVRKVKI